MILFYYVFSFSLIELDFLVHAVITQISNPIAELVILTETPTKEVKEEMETHPVIAEITTSECSI